MLPDTCGVSSGLKSRGSLQHVNLLVPSNEVKLAHALSLGGDTSKAPVTHTALAMGGCLNCLLVPLSCREPPPLPPRARKAH